MAQLPHHTCWWTSRAPVPVIRANNTRILCARPTTAGFADRSDGAALRRTLEIKVLPRPGVLTRPAARSFPINLLEMHNPRPVPPYRLVVDASAWLND